MEKVTIKMYRAGLGDCFLITLPNSGNGNNGFFYMLIDCGVFYRTEDEENLMLAVANDIKNTTGNHINLLVATHEHYDHLCGFNHAKDIFKSMTIDRVWMAWTEDPNSELARSIKQDTQQKSTSLNKFVEHVRNHKANFDNQLQENANQIEFVMQFFGAAGSASTADALNFLKEEIKSKKDYLYPGKKAIELPELPGVRFYVLGPPENLNKINRSGPSANKNEVYHLGVGTNDGPFMLAALENMMGATDEETYFEEYLPFDSQYRIKTSDVKQMPESSFFKKYYTFDKNHEQRYRTIDSDWLGMANQLALKLDDATNNTSLVLAIEFIESGRVILFPGDAQVGNWYSWEDYTWEVLVENKEKHQVQSKDLLARTVFYKVAHHGSHNATMRGKGLELMMHPDLVAMIPVNQDFARNRRPPATGWKMPFGPLLERLKEKTRGRVIISDENFPGDDSESPAGLNDSEWETFKSSCRKTDLFWEVDINTKNS